MAKSIKKLDGSSYFPQEELVKRLKEDFPEVFSEDSKVDFEKFKASLGENADLGERYGLSWKGKNEVFRTIQEIITKTLKPVRAESVDFDTSENIFIEGDNLEALKILQRSYYGKIKMIYIDPPYNTGNDFVYNDKFSQDKAEYEQEAGIRDDEGNLKESSALRKNSKDGGHYHSDWLNMMYPRLYLARNLLKHDGEIFVSIDDNEVYNLRVIMNEIFGEENFMGVFVWKTRQASGKQLAKNNISTEHEYVLVYGKNQGTKLRGNNRDRNSYSNPDKDERGDWTKFPIDIGSTREERPNCFYDLVDPSTRNIYHANPNRVWAFSKLTMAKLIEEKRIIFDPNGKTKPYLKRFWDELESEQRPISTWASKYSPDSVQINDEYTLQVAYNTEGTKEVNELFDGLKIFDYPKPPSLIKELVNQGTGLDDIVLDFFAGSGTTAHAVMQLNSEDGGNRKWIMVQLSEETEKNSEAYKAGYKTIADIGKERIRRAAKKIKEGTSRQLALEHNDHDLGFKVFKVDKTNFKVWDTNISDAEKLEAQMQQMFDAICEEVSEEALLFELIIKSGIIPTTERENKGEYWKIGGGELIICLIDKLTKELFDKILGEKPQKVILLDHSLHNDDQLKTNLLLQAEKENVDVFVI